MRDVGLTEAEWREGIRFLTATGQKCDDRRQEYILLSDTLGVSMLVDAINHRYPAGATETTVFGPFFREGAPERPHGFDIAEGAKGTPCFVSGTVRDVAGRPIEGVAVFAASGVLAARDRFVAGMIVVVALRLLAIRWGLQLPVFRSRLCACRTSALRYCLFPDIGDHDGYSAVPTSRPRS